MNTTRTMSSQEFLEQYDRPIKAVDALQSEIEQLKMFKAQYFYLNTDQPADKQRVWLSRGGNRKPVHAIYNAPEYSERDWAGGDFTLVDAGSDQHYPGNYRDKVDTWSPLKAPGKIGTSRRFLTHIGYDEHRLKMDTGNEAERALSDVWIKRNNSHGQHGFLGHLIPNPTQRDAKVAATIIQWLGTAVGGAFLAAAFRSNHNLASYFRTAVGYSERKDVRDRRAEERDLIRSVLIYIEKQYPELQLAEQGTDKFNILLAINSLRAANGLPWLDPKQGQVDG